VLVEFDKRKRIHWPLARVIELIPGRDGVERVVKLKTATGGLTRPIQRIYPLEIPNNVREEDPVIKKAKEERFPEIKVELDPINPVTVNRSGRLVKLPLRFME